MLFATLGLNLQIQIHCESVVRIPIKSRMVSCEWCIERVNTSCRTGISKCLSVEREQIYYGRIQQHVRSTASQHALVISSPLQIR